MKIKKISLNLSGKTISLRLRVCSSIFSKLRGLMFRKKESAPALLFEFGSLGKRNIHSFFVFVPFLAIWLDDKNKILQIKKINPFTFNVSSEQKFSRLIEIPLNKKYLSKMEFLVGN